MKRFMGRMSAIQAKTDIPALLSTCGIEHQPTRLKRLLDMYPTFPSDNPLSKIQLYSIYEKEEQDSKFETLLAVCGVVQSPWLETVDITAAQMFEIIEPLVNPAHRGRDYGTDIMRFTIELATDPKRAKSAGAVFIMNAPLHMFGFYEKFGFDSTHIYGNNVMMVLDVERFKKLWPQKFIN